MPIYFTIFNFILKNWMKSTVQRENNKLLSIGIFIPYRKKINSEELIIHTIKLFFFLYKKLVISVKYRATNMPKGKFKIVIYHLEGS